MRDRHMAAIDDLRIAAARVGAASVLMNDRSTSCSCGSRRYEQHKEHLLAQEMRTIVARIEKLKNKLAEMAGKEG